MISMTGAARDKDEPSRPLLRRKEVGEEKDQAIEEH